MNKSDKLTFILFIISAILMYICGIMYIVVNPRYVIATLYFVGGVFETLAAIMHYIRFKK